MASSIARAPGRWTPAARIGVRSDRLNDRRNIITHLRLQLLPDHLRTCGADHFWQAAL
jgi:hypothetical protein